MKRFLLRSLAPALAALLLLAGCRHAPAPGAAAHPGTDGLPDESLYLLESEWTDQDARPVRLADLRGKPTVVALIFTRCGYACPMTVHELKKIDARLPEDVRPDTRYVLVSMDPVRDTPEALRNFAEGYRLDAERWTLLRSDESAVRELAAVLGIRYKEEPSGEFSHENVITVLDEAGRIAFQQEGLGGDPARPAAVLAEL